MAGINLHDFTKSFKGGARPNMFRVHATEGPLLSLNENLQMVAQGASLPAATLGEIIVPYMGRQLKIPGNRTYDTWDITIINDSDFAIRDAFHVWQEAINHPTRNTSDNGIVTDAANDQYGQFAVEQLTVGGNGIRTYYIHNAWPSVVSDIELNWESNDALETFTVTLNYSHWTGGTGVTRQQGGTEAEASGSMLDQGIDALQRGGSIISEVGGAAERVVNLFSGRP